MVQNNKVLLHACCGICSGFPIEFLKNEGFSPIVYFCNPNLDTKDEYLKRLNAQQIICNTSGISLIADKYNHEEFLDFVLGLENEPERGKRCIKCIELRLIKTAIKTKELNISNFTTSLGISPHKDFQMITTIGKTLANKYGLNYLEYNYRKNNGFLKTNNISKMLGIYRQNYCGCEFAKKHLNN
ncbi:MAG: epoxyqueuosine reductase QueH [bacterium]|nr:epoxyqueuosine reductase QueH [bacterium]